MEHHRTKMVYSIGVFKEAVSYSLSKVCKIWWHIVIAAKTWNLQLNKCILTRMVPYNNSIQLQIIGPSVFISGEAFAVHLGNILAWKCDFLVSVKYSELQTVLFCFRTASLGWRWCFLPDCMASRLSQKLWLEKQLPKLVCINCLNGIMPV
jgi:hypothetical protein